MLLTSWRRTLRLPGWGIAGARDGTLRGRGRMPQHRRRCDVPELSRDRRGAALHARPGASAVGDARRSAARRGFQSEAVHEALDLCLSCKACKTECPVQVDMAATRRSFWRSTTRAAASATALYLRVCGQAGAVGFAYAGADECDSDRAVDEPADQAHRRCSAAAQLAKAGRQELRVRARLSRAENTAEEGASAPERTHRPHRKSCSGRIRGTTTTIRRRWLPPKRCSRSRVRGRRRRRATFAAGVRSTISDFWIRRGPISKCAGADGAADRCGDAVYLS